MPGDTGIPLMWATHPSNFDREQNVKQRYIRSPIDGRRAWVLFEKMQAICEAITDETISRPSRTIAAAVSSQEVSMPSTSICV